MRGEGEVDEGGGGRWMRMRGRGEWVREGVDEGEVDEGGGG